MFWKFLAGYLYNFQTKEFYNLSYAHEPPQGPARFGGLLTCVFQFQLFDFLKWYLDFVFLGGHLLFKTNLSITNTHADTHRGNS